MYSVQCTSRELWCEQLKGNFITHLAATQYSTLFIVVTLKANTYCMYIVQYYNTLTKGG